MSSAKTVSAAVLLPVSGGAAHAGPEPRAVVEQVLHYQLETDRPFFCGRDGVVKYKLAEIEKERRVGYAWYVETPRRLLEQYPAWRAKWTPGQR